MNAVGVHREQSWGSARAQLVPPRLCRRSGGMSWLSTLISECRGRLKAFPASLPRHCLHAGRPLAKRRLRGSIALPPPSHCL